MSGAVVPEGALIEITMMIRMPCAAAPDQLEEWLRMEVGRFGSMSVKNPLANQEPESWGFETPQWRDTGLRGRSEESPHVKHADGSEHYTVRRWGEPRS